MFGNGNGKEWGKPYGNLMGMGIGYTIGNENGKEWESIAREREGVGMWKAIPGHLYTPRTSRLQLNAKLLTNCCKKKKEEEEGEGEYLFTNWITRKSN